MIDVGVDHFGLFLDDIDYQLSGDNLRLFKRPGIAHAHICNKVFDFLKAHVVEPVLVMCPTEYHQIGATEYRQDLKDFLDDEIIVFGQGTGFVRKSLPKMMPNKQQKPLRSLFLFGTIFRLAILLMGCGNLSLRLKIAPLT